MHSRLSSAVDERVAARKLKCERERTVDSLPSFGVSTGTLANGLPVVPHCQLPKHRMLIAFPAESVP